MLGLTMAEVILLLVFCLLMALAAVVLNEQERREETEAQLAAATTQLSAARTEVAGANQRAVAAEELLANLMPPTLGFAATIQDDWERVVRAYANERSMEARGIQVDAIAANPTATLLMQGLLQQGFTEAQILQVLASFPRLAGPAGALRSPTEWQQIITLLGALEAADPTAPVGIEADRLVELAASLAALGITAEQLEGVSPALVAAIARLAAGLGADRLAEFLDTLATLPFDIRDGLNLPSAILSMAAALSSAGLTAQDLDGVSPATMAALSALANAVGPERLTDLLMSLAALGESAILLLGQPAAVSTDAIPGHQWPPIIKLSEADGYFFATGSAQLTPEFQVLIHEVVVPQIVQIMVDYNVNVVEVVGHTDEVPVARNTSNLDATLLAVLQGNAAVTAMAPADNAGLGLARAVAVTRELLSDPRLEGAVILPLSAAELVDTTGELTLGIVAGDVEERRRIEIRVRRADPA